MLKSKVKERLTEQAGKDLSGAQLQGQATEKAGKSHTEGPSQHRGEEAERVYQDGQGCPAQQAFYQPVETDLPSQASSGDIGEATQSQEVCVRDNFPNRSCIT